MATENQHIKLSLLTLAYDRQYCQYLIEKRALQLGSPNEGTNIMLLFVSCNAGKWCFVQ